MLIELNHLFFVQHCILALFQVVALDRTDFPLGGVLLKALMNGLCSEWRESVEDFNKFTEWKSDTVHRA